MVSSVITQDGLSESNVDPCGVCNFLVKINSALCAQCGRWTHGRCNSKVFNEFICRKCEGNIGEVVE